LKVYTTDQIRNVALAGHSSAGKTSLAEAMLFLRKHIARMGRTEDGNTQSDYLPEEVSRGISISTGLLPIEMTNAKINVVDLPGFRDFIGEISNGLAVCDAVVAVVDAQGGVEVGTEFALEAAEKRGLPVAFYINKLDKENASFDRALELLEEALPGHRFLPMALPIGEAEGLQGVVDLVKMKAIYVDDKGKVSQGPIPDDLKDRVAELRERILDEASAADDKLAEKFLSGEELSGDEVMAGLKSAFLKRGYHPVFAGSATRSLGVLRLLEFIEIAFPHPGEARQGTAAVDAETGESAGFIDRNPAGEPLVYVFKTQTDKFGTSNFIQVVSGKIGRDTALRNQRTYKDERLSHVYVQRGKSHEEVDSLSAGDLGVLLKLSGTAPNDTLAPVSSNLKVQAPAYPKPTVRAAAIAVNQSDEDKLASALHKHCAEDPTLKVWRDPELRQTIVSGMGDMHLDVLHHKLKVEKIEATFETPRTPYRETVQGKAEGSYRHKKQSGGRGQFGEVHLRVFPGQRGDGFQFGWKIVGGVIPGKYEVSIRKGIESSMERGIIAGYPVVDVHTECFDGKQHDVDSSDMAFQLASSMCFRQVARDAKPVILEPIYTLKVTVPETYIGDVMGSLSGKRGRIMNQDIAGGKATIEAHVPLAELYEYSRELRSMTQGRGVFEMDYDHYAAVPGEVQSKLIEAHDHAEEGNGKHH
jgi:elongation factor G